MVFNERNDILLIKRGKEPHYGRWMVPGGSLEWGETLEQAAIREVLEETGIEIEIEAFGELIEAITPGENGFHYVIVDYVAHANGGVLHAGSDALEATWARLDDLNAFDLTEDLARVIQTSLRVTGRSR